MVGSLITAGLSAVGSMEQGAEEQNAENANVKNDLTNATNSQVAAKANAQGVERETKSAVADAQASFSAAGVDANSGSPLAVMHDVATKGELARRLTVYQGQLQAHGYAAEAANAKARGDADMTAAYFKSGTTLLTALDNEAESSGLRVGG